MIARPLLGFPPSRFDNPNGGSLAAGTSYGNLSDILGYFSARDLQDNSMLWVKASGRFTTPAAAGATAFVLRFGTTSVSFAQTQNLTPSNSLTNATWKLEFKGVVRFTNANSAGFMWTCAINGLTGATSSQLAPATAPVVGTAFDPTVIQGPVYLGMISAAATGGQSFQCHEAQLIWQP